MTPLQRGEISEISHPISACDKRLQSLPNFDRFRCQPPEFICACGRRWVHVCDEAEGCFYALAKEGVLL